MEQETLEWPESLLQIGSWNAQHIYARDWSDTPLGPLASWPLPLRIFLHNMLSSSYPTAVYWSADYFYFCNDAFAPLVGENDYSRIGKRYVEAFPDQNPMMLEAFHRMDSVFKTGQAIHRPDTFIPLVRNGELQEIYHWYHISPLRDESGRRVGVEVVNFERTQDVIREQQMGVLRALSTEMSQLMDIQAAYDACLRVLGLHRDVFPFAAIYHRAEATEPFVIHGGAGIAIPSAHTLTVQDPLHDQICPVPPFPIESSARIEIFGPPTRAFLMPIHESADDSRGLLMVGLRPGVPWTPAYCDFLRLLEEQVKKGVLAAREWEHSQKKSHELAELDRVKTEFISNVSHEFRIPLTLILGPAEELLKQKTQSLAIEGRADVLCIWQNSLRLLKLVNSLLAFSRIRAGSHEALFVATPADELTRHLCEVFRPSIEQAGLEFHVHCHDLSEPVYLDPDLWERIILNLLSNALKFTFVGDIEVNQWAEHGELYLEVRDTGVGMEKAETQDIFKHFHRVESARGRAPDGSGIGLALVDECVALHGGHISVASGRNEGTRFLVSIPLGKDHLPPDKIRGAITLHGEPYDTKAMIIEAQKWSEPLVPQDKNPHESKTFRIDGRRPILLIVDDNKDMQHYLQRILSRTYDLRLASIGDEAFSLARAARPDIILNAAPMPPKEAQRFLRELRNDPDMKNTPMLSLNTKGDESSKTAGLETGMEDALTQPFSARDLEVRLENLLRLFIIRRDAAKREAQLAAEKEAAHLSNRLKDEFFRTLGHELRTPLMAIDGAAQILSEAPSDSAAFAQALLTLKKGVANEIAIINQIMDFSYLRSGRLPIDLRVFDLKQLLPAVIIEQREKARTKKIRIASEFLPGALPVLADEARLKQVLGSVIDNAIKFSPGSSQIILKGAWEDDACTVQVIDQGIGISPEILPYVCDPFRQEHTSLTRLQGGLGLGLALAKEIMEKLQGQLIVESPGPECGTTVTLRLSTP